MNASITAEHLSYGVKLKPLLWRMASFFTAVLVAVAVGSARGAGLPAAAGVALVGVAGGMLLSAPFALKPPAQWLTKSDPHILLTGSLRAWYFTILFYVFKAAYNILLAAGDLILVSIWKVIGLLVRRRA